MARGSFPPVAGDPCAQAGQEGSNDKRDHRS